MKKLVVTLALTAALGTFGATASAHEACTEDANCAQGEVCYEKECSASCKTDSDCPEEQVCAGEKACLHADDHDDSGCSTAPGGGGSHALSLFGVALAVAAVRLARRRTA